MRTILIAAAFALSACATTQDIYGSEIDETAYIDRPMVEVSSCLAMQLSETPIQTAEGEQTFIVKNGYGATMALLTLSEEEGRTRIDARAPNSLVGTGYWDKCR